MADLRAEHGTVHFVGRHVFEMSWHIDRRVVCRTMWGVVMPSKPVERRAGRSKMKLDERRSETAETSVLCVGETPAYVANHYGGA